MHRTDKIRRSFVEGTQRGYAVGVVTPRGRIVLSYIHDDGTTKGIDAAYSAASATATSINRGRFVGSRDGFVFVVRGRTLTTSR